MYLDDITKKPHSESHDFRLLTVRGRVLGIFKSPFVDVIHMDIQRSVLIFFRKVLALSQADMQLRTPSMPTI
jgi:hypothetical protein